MQGKSVWIISVPLQQGKDVFSDLQTVAREDTEEVHKFGIPDLRVGNIDSLITLSDELRKLDAHVEGTLRKILVQYEELAELRQDPKNQLVVTKDGVLCFVSLMYSNPFDVYYQVQVGRSQI